MKWHVDLKLRRILACSLFLLPNWSIYRSLPLSDALFLENFEGIPAVSSPQKCLVGKKRMKKKKASDWFVINENHLCKPWRWNGDQVLCGSIPSHGSRGKMLDAWGSFGPKETDVLEGIEIASTRKLNSPPASPEEGRVSGLPVFLTVCLLMRLNYFSLFWLVLSDNFCLDMTSTPFYGPPRRSVSIRMGLAFNLCATNNCKLQLQEILSYNCRCQSKQIQDGMRDLPQHMANIQTYAMFVRQFKSTVRVPSSQHQAKRGSIRIISKNK